MFDLIITAIELTTPPVAAAVCVCLPVEPQAPHRSCSRGLTNRGDLICPLVTHDPAMTGYPLDGNAADGVYARP